MRMIYSGLAAVVSVVLLSNTATAQSPASQVSVPRVITVTGVFQPVDGQPPQAVETVTLAVYADQVGGTPLWQETQSIALDVKGRYALLLGATSPEGLPATVLAAGPQWLGMKFDRPGEVESARAQLTSVPYTLRAADADTLGGRPASAYVLAPTSSDGHTTGSTGAQAGGSGEMAASASGREPSVPQAVLPGTVNFLSKYVSGADIGDSAVFENLGRVGIGTAAPRDVLHINFTNTNGSLTGLAVQNLGNTATSYSGTLFYDHNGVLGQFQGFNNVTHEYRINNIGKNGASVFDGSINFMTGNTSRFLVASNGNIGIGTTSPSALLEVSNAVPGGPANMWMTSYTNAVGPYYMARRARGTAVAPTAVQNGDGLSGLYGMGYGATQFGPAFTGGITVQAAQNFTDTQQGTAIMFSTTAINATVPTTRMTLDASGNLGIGTATVPAAGILEVSNATTALPFGAITGSSFTGTNSGGTLFVGRKARGTSAAPTAVQNGDNLVGFLAQGYGVTGFSGTRGGMFVRAAETWTDTFQGTSIAFNTTAIGTNTPATRVTITPFGNVGVGTTAPQTSFEIVRNGEANIQSTSYNDGDGSAVFFQRARGTSAAPTAIQAGDVMGYFGAGGYGTTGFGDGAGAMAIIAAENWTDTANGATVAFASTSIGTTDFVPRMVILPSGFVGIGTPGDANGIPTATDRLQVFGDARVGDAGTNGCLKRFDGNFLVGTCVSDRRFKKNITPFGRVLDQLSALQPVNYYWRAAEYPERHFGDSQAYGLIAQDVEQILPELVVTSDDGYKAVDYTKLPLLTIEAVKELKTENDALKQRVAELDPLKAACRRTRTPAHQPARDAAISAHVKESSCDRSLWRSR